MMLFEIIIHQIVKLIGAIRLLSIGNLFLSDGCNLTQAGIQTLATSMRGRRHYMFMFFQVKGKSVKYYAM